MTFAETKQMRYEKIISHTIICFHMFNIIVGTAVHSKNSNRHDSRKAL